MEGKTVILSVLLMSLVMAQIQVEAKVCCPTRSALRRYRICRRQFPPAFCARRFRCRLVPGNIRCPSCCPFSGPTVNEYCNLGCEASVCGALNNLENSDTSENVVNEALEKCIKACSTLCATGSNTALDQIALEQIAPDEIARDQIAPDQIALDQIAPDQIALDQIAPDQIALDQIALDQSA